MLRLVKEYKNVNNFVVSENYLITTLKGGMELHRERDFHHVGKLDFSLYPRVVEKNKESFIIQDRNIFYNIKYNLEREQIFKIDVHELWNTHYINNEFMFVLYADPGNQIHMCKYDLRSNAALWTSACEPYSYFWFDPRHLIISSKDSHRFKSLNTNTGETNWESNMTEVFSKLYPSDPGVFRIDAIPQVYKDTLITKVKNLESDSLHLVAINIENGKVKWHKTGYSNFELYDSNLYNLEFDGLYRVLSITTGEIKQEVDLASKFQEKGINCIGRFSVTDSHIYFKDTRRSVVGILNVKSLKIEDVQRMPEKNGLSSDEYPVPIGDRLYVRSAPQNNLFVFERIKDN